MTSDQPKLQYPVLLAHGFGGFSEIRVELFNGFNPGIEYFNGVAELLRGHGAPEVYTAEVPRTGSIEQRAAALRKFADEKIAAPRFHVIAHSMGGLDARQYIARLDGHRRVVSLTTLGTPHRGSPVADLAIDALVRPLFEAVESLGLKNWRPPLEQYFAGHHDLTPARLEQFNRQTPDHPAVTYCSWGGNPPREAVHWVFRPFYELLLHLKDGGPNDGLVTVASAKWSGWRGEVPADHLSLINWQFLDPPRRHFKPADFYLGLLKELLQIEREKAQLVREL